jgi:iron-sulfur cluster assembly protein
VYKARIGTSGAVRHDISYPALGKSALILSLPLIVAQGFGRVGSGKASRALKESMTTEVANPVVPKIHVSERAAKKIITLLAKDGVSPEQGGLRVGVQGGGCSGLSYAMRLDTQARDRDKIFEEFGARIFVDPKSLLYLNGTTLDYEETLMRQGFVFVNPQAARSCGCGSSFTA